jgi:hypothetical protein
LIHEAQKESAGELSKKDIVIKYGIPHKEISRPYPAIPWGRFSRKFCGRISKRNWGPPEGCALCNPFSFDFMPVSRYRTPCGA